MGGPQRSCPHPTAPGCAAAGDGACCLSVRGKVPSRCRSSKSQNWTKTSRSGGHGTMSAAPGTVRAAAAPEEH